MAKVKKPSAKKPAAKNPVAKKAAAKKKPVKKTAVKKSVPPKSTKKISRRALGLPEQLRDAAMTVLNERQAEEIVSFDLEGRSSVADYLIVASGRSTRQLTAIAQYLTEAFEKLGVERVRAEGLPEANWVLIDGGDVIVHLFLPNVRGFYNLEGIWSRKAS